MGRKSKSTTNTGQRPVTGHRSLPSADVLRLGCFEKTLPFYSLLEMSKTLTFAVRMDLAKLLKMREFSPVPHTAHTELQTTDLADRASERPPTKWFAGISLPLASLLPPSVPRLPPVCIPACACRLDDEERARAVVVVDFTCPCS